MLPPVTPVQPKTEVTLRCDKHGRGGEKLWFYSHRMELPRNKFPIHKGNHLVIESFDSNQEGYYFCFAKNKALKKNFWARTLLRIQGIDLINY